MESTLTRPDAPTVLAAVRRGDPDALAAVYREHAPRLLRTLTALLGDRADAEDVVHDLFVGLPEALGRYQERGTFGAWLRAVGVRMGLTRLRVRRRRPQASLEAAEHLSRPAEDERLARRLLVEGALATLPAKLRVVVVLRELEGWPYRDIAQHLGMREGAVITRHCRAMQRLRKALEGQR